MTHIRRFLNRIAALFRFNKAEAELSREIASHLRLLEDQFVAGGMSADDARFAARRAFGGIEQTKERQRDARGFRWLTGWPMDMKLGVRMLVKSPGLTVIALVALAVAITAGAAYMEFTQDLLNPKLPIEGGDRVVGIQVWQKDAAAPEERALADFVAWRGSVRTIEHLGATKPLERHLITDDGRIDGERGVEISAEAFRLVPTAPLLGRGLVNADEQPGAASVVVIGHDLWETRFARDPNIIGRAVRLGSTFYSIVGVMPPEFAFPANQNLWVPLTPPGAPLKRGEGPAIRMFGRLREGVAIDAARAELNASMRETHGQVSADVRPYIAARRSADPDNKAQTIVLYAANVFFIMLLGICGANVAILVFARTVTRESEITVRTALGATRPRICAQLFTEALVLSLLAAGTGLLGAAVAGRWIKHTFTKAQGQPAPFWWNDHLNAETVLYAVLLAVIAAVIVGVVPALKATGAVLQDRLRETGAGVSTMKFGRMWTGIIIGQVAITMLFLISLVSLGWQTYLGQNDYEVTFPREQVLTAQLTFDQRKSSETRAAAYRELARQLRAQPGVAHVTFGNALPGFGSSFPFELSLPGAHDGQRLTDEVLRARSARVAPNFFETFNMSVVAGRLFTESEGRGDHKVTVVDETFVRLALGGRNAVGVMVRQPPNEVGKAPGPWYQIIGVVKDVTLQPDKRMAHAMLYMPADVGAIASPEVMVRTHAAAAPFTHRLQEAALAVDPDIRLSGVVTMDRLADSDALAMHFVLRAFLIVAAVALLLSTAGIYSLISFTLARRTREIGIRIALGAAPRRIVTSVFARAFVQIGLGLAAGSLPGVVIITLGLGEASDGVGLAAGFSVSLTVALFIVLVAAAACMVPLRRALRIQPTEALRTN